MSPFFSLRSSPSYFFCFLPFFLVSSRSSAGWARLLGLPPVGALPRETRADSTLAASTKERALNGPGFPSASSGPRTCSAPVAASQAELTNPAWISQSLLEGGLKATGHPRPGVDSRQIRDARELGLRGVHLGHRPALRGDLLLSVGLEPTVCLKE